jgi:hypothetical protein
MLFLAKKRASDAMLVVAANFAGCQKYFCCVV